jgi:NAD(P)-dependent dehydrogenase (short-subunit alcohol dehydrogenase family)
LDQFTRCCALELASKGIRVNSVNPGTVQTQVHLRGLQIFLLIVLGGMSQETYENYLEESKEAHPLGRIGQPEDIVGIVDFISSEKASWITGQSYAVDGGRNLVCSGGKSLFDPKK